MASPQKENGYTPIANEIMEALVNRKLSGQELRLILLVLRKTYGFRKKDDRIALSQMAKAINSHPVRCSQTIKKLVLANLLTVSENINGIGKSYCFQKDYSKWSTISESANPKQKVKDTLSEKRKTPLAKNESTKETLTKETIQKKDISKEIEAKLPSVELTDYFYKKYEEKTKNLYARNFAKDRKQVNHLLKSLTIDILKKKADVFFTEDKWFTKDGNYSLDNFVRHINEVGIFAKRTIPKNMDGIAEWVNQKEVLDARQENICEGDSVNNGGDDEPKI